MVCVWVWVCVCVCVCVYVCVCVVCCVCVCVCVCVCAHMCVHLSAFLSVCLPFCLSVCVLSVFVHLSVCVSVLCVHVRLIFACVCTHTVWTHMHTHMHKLGFKSTSTAPKLSLHGIKPQSYLASPEQWQQATQELTRGFAWLGRANDSQPNRDHRLGAGLLQVGHGVINESVPGLGGAQVVQVLPVDAGEGLEAWAIHRLNAVSLMKLGEGNKRLRTLCVLYCACSALWAAGYALYKFPLLLLLQEVNNNNNKNPLKCTLYQAMVSNKPVLSLRLTNQFSLSN